MDDDFPDANEEYANVRAGAVQHPLDPRRGNRGAQGELQSRLADDPAPPAVEMNLPVNYAEVVKDPPDQAVLTVNTSWGKTVQIKQWHWDRLKPDALITLEGKRRSGKTNLLRNMLKAMRRYYPEVYIFTGTKMSQEYKGLVPDRYIFDNLQQFPPDSPQYPGGMDAFLHIWHRQVERVEAMRKRGKNDKNIDVLVIIEDLVANEQSHRGFHDIPLFNRIAYNGVGITFVGDKAGTLIEGNVFEGNIDNIGKSGGGANIFRGHDNVQGATDVGPNPDSLPGYYGLAAGSWKHWCNVWGVDYEWVKKQFASQGMMEKSGITVSRWIDGVLEANENIDQDSNIRAVVYWGMAPNSQTRGLEMVEAMKKLDMLVVIEPPFSPSHVIVP